MSEEENTETEAPEESIRDSLSAAFDEDQIETEITEDAENEVEAVDAEGANTAAAEPLDDKATAPAVDALDAPPASWSPTAREEWAKVPETVRATIAKREKEIQTTMQESAQARQLAQSFNQMVQPFQGMFAAQGATNAVHGVEQVLHSVAQLQGGTPAAKAAAAAQIIKQFGVGIRELDDALVGNAQAQPPADPRFDELQTKYDSLASRLQANDNEVQQQINIETNKFLGEKPFANDLRVTMADFMDLASRQGQKLTLQEAYDRALATRPDIQTILSNRAKAEAGKKNITNARKAGVIVPISSEGGGPPVAPANLRGALEAAWDNG